MTKMCPLEKSIELARVLCNEKIWLYVINRPDVKPQTAIGLAKESKSSFVLFQILEREDVKMYINEQVVA